LFINKCWSQSEPEWFRVSQIVLCRRYWRRRKLEGNIILSGNTLFNDPVAMSDGMQRD